uniref:C2H2-type domain-containing protein n=1 Tax=viral metagenome TaxID=1070528 RepID=A0A6C0CYP1_9ZZZZ
MNCEYCKKNFKTKSILNTHQKTAKYCLIKRGIIEENNSIIIEDYQCEYCNKSLTTKYTLNAHIETCSVKLKMENKTKKNKTDKCLEEQKVIYEIQLENKNKQLEEQKINYEMQLENKNKQIQEQRIQIKELQDTIASIASQPKNITTHNNNRTNTTTNNRLNIINNLVPITDDEFKKLPDMLKREYVESGLDGYIKLATEFYKDKAVCTDVSRKIVTHKDENGKVVTDPNMTKLNSRFFKAILNKNRELTYILVDEVEKKVNDREMNIDDLINFSCKYSNQRVNVIKLANGEETGEVNDTEGEYMEFKNTYTNRVCDSISIKK